MRALLLALVLPLAFLSLYLFQSYFIDEAFVMTNVSSYVASGTIIPPETNYPPLFSYLATPAVAAVTGAAYLLSDAPSLKVYALVLKMEQSILFVFGGRLLSFAALCAIVAAYSMVLFRRFGPIATFASVLLLLTVRPLVVYAGRALPDLLMTGFVLATFLALVRSGDVSDNRRSLPSDVLAGLFAGLAVASKYNGAAAAFLVAAAVVDDAVRRRNLTVLLRRGLVAAAACVLGFLLAAPSWVIAPGHMLRGVAAELSLALDNQTHAVGIPVLGQLELMFNASPVLFVTAVAGVVFLDRRNRLDRYVCYLFLASVILPALNGKQAEHYILPAFLALCYFAALAVSKALGWAKARVVLPAAAVATFLYANFGAAFAMQPDSVALAKTWIDRNVGANDRIALDWAFMPRIFSAKEISYYVEVSRTYGHPQYLQDYVARNERIFEKEDIRHDVAWLESTPTDYLVTTDRVFRLYLTPGWFTGRAPQGGEAGERSRRRREFYERLFSSPRWTLAHKTGSPGGFTVYIFRNRATAEK